MTDRFAIPPTFKPGCLVRGSLPGQVAPLFGDKIEIIPRDQWRDHIGRISLRPYVEKIFDQGNAGSCAAEASTQALQISRAFAGRPFVQLSPWFVYHTTSGGRDQGSNIDSNLEFLRKYGAAPMSVWGRDKGWRAEPSAEAKTEALKYRVDEFYDVTTVEEFGTALIKGFAVVYGRRGHALVATELKSTTHFEYANSWHESWGDGGFGTDSLNGINWAYGAWAVRTANEAD